MSDEKEGRGPPTAKDPHKFTKADKQKLKRHIDTIDALKLQQAELGTQVKEALNAAEADGFSKKRINDVLKKRRLRRKQTAGALDEAQLHFEKYWEASGGDKFADALEDDEEYEIEDDTPQRGRGGGFN
ncbi:GapR family DNA-binding domain-containing protein [Vitreimonas flagellata]|uniref:GapR family DNA-binding domain-containing protein n=1 Tax=Vitreimonas flagellata TaxID=2560861 RepID=UPI001430C436|nr:GapR family DNA-binding domain-containing protein [Vitreimonas flagellata]